MSKKTSPVMLAGVLPQSALLAVLLLAASLSPKAAVLVNLDATSLPEGALPTWSNTGTEPGDFIASPVVPSVTTVDSVKGVTFNGTDHYYTGPESSISVVGDGDRTIEAWLYNPVIADEETIMSWGARGGPDGSNMSFNHGTNPTFGAAGHWGAADVGWANQIAGARWTYVVYTYDSWIYTASVYMDGQLATSKDVGTLDTREFDTANAVLPYRIASQNEPDGTATTGLRGSMTIARIRVHDVPLTATEIANKFVQEGPTFGINDSDGDGLPNWYENGYDFLNYLDPTDAALDQDQDGLSNLREYELTTRPDLQDTDGDGANDGAEVNRMAGGVAAPTDPLRADTDYDGLLDGVETDTGIFVGPSDTGTDPLLEDSDGDTYVDGLEVLKGSDPNLASSVPTVGGDPLVLLDAAGLPTGALPSWTNQGALAGVFQASPSVPQVQIVQGVQGVTFNGNAQYYTGPAAPVWIAGNGAHSVEAWVNNPAAADEETIFGWGRRGGPDGSNMSFNHGLNATWGAVGHWGTPDMGWNGTVAENQWTYVVATYDPTTTTGELYKDGASVVTEIFPAPLDLWSVDSTAAANPLPFRIAAQTLANGQVNNGLFGSLTIARLRVYDRTLTAAEVQSSFTAGADEFGLVDYDGDGLPTWYEREYPFLDERNPADAGQDQDLDGLSNLTEFNLGTAPDNADTDGDLASDGKEVNQLLTMPLVPDTDGDGLRDGVETGTGTYVSSVDTGTNPLQLDTDGDSYIDGLEVIRGSNPVLASSVPDLQPLVKVVNLDASALATGPLAEWTNQGAMGGVFKAKGNGVPAVSVVQGAKGVTLDGISQFYSGPVAPAYLTGNAARTVDAWILNPVVADEETIFTWGRRGGPDGSNMSFNHGLNATYGAAGHWGAPDIGWNGTTVEGAWTYVAYSYDPATSTGTVYTDGQQANQKVNGPLVTHSMNDNATTPVPLVFRLGTQTDASGAANTGLTGSMTYARIRVYDNALTAAEILSIYDTEKSGFAGGPSLTLGPATIQDGNLTFTWSTVPGATYAVEATDTVDTGWQPVATGLTTPGYSDPIGPGPRYYRVKTE